MRLFAADNSLWRIELTGTHTGDRVDLQSKAHRATQRVACDTVFMVIKASV
jgi:hypothetical protein